MQEATGGVASGILSAILNVVKRGLFSNEASMGSTPNITAIATPKPHHSSSQGFVQALGVFIELTQQELFVHIGDAGIYFITIVLLSGTIVKLTEDYLEQRKKGLEPTFEAKIFPELKDKIDVSIWKK